jgi:cytochrome c oxidase assembly protein subunit 15
VPSLRLHRYAQACAVAAFFVIFAGAMVTSTGSGMAVPDWPQSFGGWLPKMEGGVLFEDGHRKVAGFTGMLVIGLALWLQFSGARPLLRRLGWYAVIAVLSQALLGGLTVLIGTDRGWNHTHPLVSTAHACLAQALFSLLVSIAVISAPGWAERPERAQRVEGFWPAGMVALAYLQIILGAVMRHQGAGLIIPDFPLNYGRLVPEFNDWRIGVNYAHRVGALAVLVSALALSTKVLRSGASAWVKQPAKVLFAAVLVQVCLGALTVWSRLQPVIASAHVIGGALVLASSLVLALRAGKRV